MNRDTSSVSSPALGDQCKYAVTLEAVIFTGKYRAAFDSRRARGTDPAAAG
jgi:hypothetical protein